MHRTVKKPMRLYQNILWISISHDDLPKNIVQFTSVIITNSTTIDEYKTMVQNIEYI